MDSLLELIDNRINKAAAKSSAINSALGQVVSIDENKYSVKILTTGSVYELPNYSGSDVRVNDKVYVYWKGGFLSNQSAYIGAAPTTYTKSNVYVPSIKTYGDLTSEYKTITTIAVESFIDTYTTLNFNAIIDCEESGVVSLIIVVDSTTISYAPKLTTVIGHNHISFVLPIHLEETGEHIIYVKAKGSGSINHAESFLTGANIEEREIDTHGFQLNVANFNPNEPYLYDVNGNIIGVVTMGSGTIADNVYTTEGGLHVTGLTFGNINVDLPLNEEWTIEYSIKDYVFDSDPTNTVNWIFNSSNAGLETAAVKDFNSHAVHCRLAGSVNPTLYNYCALSGSENGFYDFATEPSMLYGFELNYKWINDGLNLSLWVNGMRKATLPSRYFTQENINKIGIPNSGNTAGNNRNGLVVTKLKVLDYADTTTDRVLYKWHITKFKGYEDWFTVKRFKLYTANDELIDQNEDNYVCIFTNNGSSQDGVKNWESLAYSLLAKAQSDGVYHDHGYIYRPNHTVDGDVIDVIYSVPSSLPDVSAYSYVAPADPNEAYNVRQPVSWTFQKSTDGGVTWTTLDTQTDVPVPYRGQETAKFAVT